VVTRTDDPLWPRIVAFETVEVHSPDDLLDVLSGAADRDPAPCVVRAAPLADIGRRAINDDAEAGPAGMRVTPRSWVGYDIEKVPAGGIDPLREPEWAVAKARQCLPPEHHDTTVVRSPRAPASAQTSYGCACGSSSTVRCSAARSKHGPGRASNRSGSTPARSATRSFLTSSRSR
jgi:hypothetical protein